MDASGLNDIYEKLKARGMPNIDGVNFNGSKWSLLDGHWDNAELGTDFAEDLITMHAMRWMGDITIYLRDSPKKAMVFYEGGLGISEGSSTILESILTSLAYSEECAAGLKNKSDSQPTGESRGPAARSEQSC